MAKNVLKVVLLALVFISIVLVPIVGVDFYDSASIFDEGAIYKSHDFANGANIVVSFTPDEGSSKTVDDAAKILENRFTDFGYVDTTVKAENGKLTVSTPMSNSVEDIVTEVAIKGEWTLTDLNGTEFLKFSDCEKAELATSNGYYFANVTVKKDKIDLVKSDIDYVASSGAAYAYLSVDGQNMAFIQVDSSLFSSKTGELLVGPLQASAVSTIVPIINSGSAEGEFKIEKVTKDYAPKISEGAQKVLFIALLVVLVLVAVSLVLVNKEAGIGAALAVISNAAVIVTSLANRNFVFSIVSLIIMVIAVLMTWGINFYAISSLKTKKLLKVSLTSIWIHLAVFAVTVVLWLIAKGTLYTIGSIFMTAAVSSFVTFFLFTVAFTDALKSFKNDK